MNDTKKRWLALGESLKRGERYERELATLDPATRASLLAAWKEQIIGDLIALLQATDDVDAIANIDRAIGLSMDVNGVKPLLRSDT